MKKKRLHLKNNRVFPSLHGFFFFRTSNTIVDAYCLGVLDLFTEALIGGNGPFSKCSAVVFVKRSQ